MKTPVPKNSGRGFSLPTILKATCSLIYISLFRAMPVSADERKIACKTSGATLRDRRSDVSSGWPTSDGTCNRAPSQNFLSEPADRIADAEFRLIHVVPIQHRARMVERNLERYPDSRSKAHSNSAETDACSAHVQSAPTTASRSAHDTCARTSPNPPHAAGRYVQLQNAMLHDVAETTH